MFRNVVQFTTYMLDRGLLQFGAAGILLVFSFGACKTYSEMPEAPVEATSSFSRTGKKKVPERWWKEFGESELNRLVRQALTSNFDLKTAWYRLREARAVVDREYSSLYPSLNVTAQGEIRQGETDFETADDDEDLETEEQLQTGLSAEYEVDLWGRINSAVEAEQYRAKATYEDFQAAGLSLAGEVVRTWLRLMKDQNELNLLAQQLEANEQVLSLVEKQFRAGQVRRVDILRQRQLVESTREQIHEVESRIQVLEHQLAVLLGRQPQQGVSYDTMELPRLPSFPQTGVPANLIQRRPDVRSAFLRLKASDRDLASAVSDQYPRLTLDASTSKSGGDVNDLFETWARSFSASMVAPLIDAGRRRSEVERNETVRKQRLYEYGREILIAFREVENAIVQEQKQLDQIESLQQQLDLAESAYEQLRDQYVNGTTPYIDVLQALTEEQQLQRDLLTARLELLEFRVALYRALAGGFDIEKQVRKNNQKQKGDGTKGK